MPKTKPPRLVIKGDIVEVPGTDRTEVVRDVSVVLHLSNGQDLAFRVDEEVTIGDKEDLSELAAAAQADADERAADAEEEAAASGDGVTRVKKPATKKAKK